MLGEAVEILGQRVVALAELAQQRAVHDEIGVAADRRGEVAVRRAGEAGVAQVLRVVARPLQGPQDERRKGEATAPRLRDVLRDPFGDRAGERSGILGRELLRRRRRRHAEVGELRQQMLDCLRVRALVHAVERLATPRREQLTDDLVRADHQLLDQHVGVRLGLEPCVGHLPSPSKRNASSGVCTCRAPRANLAARHSVARRSFSASCAEHVGRRLATLGLGVREPRVGTDDRAVEERFAAMAAARR